MYVLAGVGYSSQNSPGNAGGSNLSGSASATALKLGAGIQITPRFGAELTYAPLGKVSIGTPSGTANYNTKVTTISGTANFPLNERFSVVGRLGFGFSSSSLTVPALGYSGSANERPLVLGLGLRYALNPKLDLTADYDNYSKLVKFSGGGSANASAFTVGIRCGF